jgi:hypothetical protein
MSGIKILKYSPYGINHWGHNVPQFVPLPLAQAKNGDKHFGNKSCMQPMRRLSWPSWRVQLFFFLEGAGLGFFLFFPLISNVFPLCSHQILKRFPKLFFTMVPKQHLSFIPYGLPKVQLSVVWQAEKMGDRGSICVYFVTWGPKRCIYWRVPNIPKQLMMGQSIWLLKKKTKKKKREKVVSAPMN